MKLRLKIIILVMMAMYCMAPASPMVVDAASNTRTVAVHATNWTVHGVYSKSSTSKTMYATNYSGYGEYGYCYGHCRSDLSGQWVQYSSNYKLYI